MIEGIGLECTYSWGSNFEILFRIEGSVSRLLRRNAAFDGSGIPATSQGRPSLRRRVKAGAATMLSVASFPTEWVCQKVPLASPTHSVMIFRKQLSL
jgi:hypothetical protein